MQKLYESLVTLWKNDHVHVDKVDNKKKNSQESTFSISSKCDLIGIADGSLGINNDYLVIVG